MSKSPRCSRGSLTGSGRTGTSTVPTTRDISPAYVTIGAPPFDASAEPSPATIDDEHDAKLAFACADLASSLDSDRFRAAAVVYAPTR